ncbi:Phage integrase [Plesiocystis pacifica SIR-1]|uniref:Phage integrase n=2 Tax=Plesiocystis pacifica TaxID=191768 RepID=A6GBT9_9BACT|nr:Phage integrase [Plesiocystis pacifica SIR-1]
MDRSWRFRAVELEAWIREREQSHPAQPSGVGHSQPGKRASPQKAKRTMKITVKARTQGTGGLEANLFWTDSAGKRVRVRRASPHKSKAKTKRWAERLLTELMEAHETKLRAAPPAEQEQPQPPQQPVFSHEHERAQGGPTQDEDRPRRDHAQSDDKRQEEDVIFEDFVPRFMAFCESPVAGRRGANSTGELSNKRGTIEQHLSPYFGEMPLRRIGARQVDAYVCAKAQERSKRTGKPLSASTIANHLAVLRRMLKVAHRWELIDRVPDIQPPRKGTVDNYLSKREAQALLEHADPLTRDLFMLALRTGMRLGELRELRTGDVDLANGRIQVRRQRTQEGEVTPPKYGRKRTVQVPADALEVLRKRLAGLGRKELVFSKPKGYKAAHRGERAAKGGEPWSHKDLFNAVNRARAGAGIERSVGVHTLRHTFATHAVAAGVPLSLVSRQLGHSDVRTTMRYAHHAPELTPGIFDRLSEPAGGTEGPVTAGGDLDEPTARGRSRKRRRGGSKGGSRGRSGARAGSPRAQNLDESG